MAFFDIYKKNQGRNTRLWTLVSVLAIIAIGCYWLSNELDAFNAFVRYLAPLAVGLALAYGAFRFVYQKESMSEFLIATEGEMKKVSWSSKKEVIGSTKVVVFTTVMLAVMLFVVDIVFRFFFEKIGVLRLSQ